jgi:redox-sensitive bicupin YhaK (pirin superfamily)
MWSIRKDKEIYSADGGWFQARWHFSFDRYRDEQQIGVGALRVFNDDRIVGGAVWPMHPHRDIESLTYVVDGHFEHADSLGNNGTLEPGAAQVMSFSHAGDEHSERNGSDTSSLRFIQFWILPATLSGVSTVQQHQYTEADRTDRWLQIMSPPGEDGLDLRQEARVWVSRLTPGTGLSRRFDDGRGAYVYLIDGGGTLNGDPVGTGDAAKIHGPEDLTVAAGDPMELIVIDVPLRFRHVGVWARQ